MSGHWPIFKDKETNHSWICAYEHTGNTYSPIALVEYGEERPVRQLLRYAELGEQIEEIIDQVLGGSLSKEDAMTRIQVRVTSCVRNIMVHPPAQTQCPEIRSLDNE